MAFTQQDLDNVEAAIVSGTLSVSVEGKSVTYRSFDELRTIRRIIMQSLGLLKNKPTILVAHDRGHGGAGQ